jgi:hypothetical protein
MPKAAYKYCEAEWNQNVCQTNAQSALKKWQVSDCTHQMAGETRAAQNKMSARNEKHGASSENSDGSDDIGRHLQPQISVRAHIMPTEERTSDGFRLFFA